MAWLGLAVVRYIMDANNDNSIGDNEDDDGDDDETQSIQPMIYHVKLP